MEPPIVAPGGFFLSLLTESFAVRALVGSLVAASLAGAAVRCGLVRSSRARRILVLAPVLVAALTAGASVRDAEAYLPQLWLASSASGASAQLLELLGDFRWVATSGVDVLVVSYGAIVSLLVGRRLVGLLVVRRLLRRGREAAGYGAVVAVINRLAVAFEMDAPRLVILPDCPGGAFSAGLRRPVVAVDPDLLAVLDERELEGLLAHELAHIARRDPLVGWLVGGFRDLTFFVLPVHLAARWLRREQEESADEHASIRTGRPVALASSILKVYDAHQRRRVPTAACAAVAVADGWWNVLPLRRGRGEAAVTAVASRVERLLAGRPSVSRLRRRVEISFAGGVLAAATGLSLAVPGWIASDLNTYSLSFGYLAPQPLGPVESPALATFRGLTADAPVTSPAPPQPTTATSLEPIGAGETLERPGVETRSQLAALEPASVPAVSTSMLWAAEDARPWEIHSRHGERAHQARPLWTLSDTGSQVGFFLVAQPSD